MILTAERERAGDRLNDNVLYVVLLRLAGSEIDRIQGVEDTKENKKEEYHYVYNISDSLLHESSFCVNHAAESRYLGHHSQRMGKVTTSDDR